METCKKILFIGDYNIDKYKYGDVFKYLDYDYEFYLPDEMNTSKDNNNYLLIVTPLEWIPSWRRFIINQKYNNAKILYVLDGIVDWYLAFENDAYILNEGTFLQPTYCDKIAAIGINQINFLNFIGCGDKAEIVGIPRFDRYSSLPQRKSQKTVKALLIAPKTFALNENSRFYRQMAVKDVINYFRDRNDIEIITRGIAGNVNDIDGLEYSNNNDIYEDLKGVDFVISLTSTSIFDSASCNIPTAILEYDNQPNLIAWPWIIKSKYDIQPIVEELLAPDSVKMKLQHHMLSNNISHIGSSSERLAELINKMVVTNHSDLADKLLDTNIASTVNGLADFRNYSTSNYVYRSRNISFLQYELDCYKQMYEKIKELHNKDYIINIEHENSLCNRTVKKFSSLKNIIWSKFKL